MANTFTPEQIAQILEEFFETVGTRQYIGARYVPIFGRKGESSIEWDNTGTYEPLSIVLYQGNSFTSRQYVPVGVEITNQEFWAQTGNYNAQVEQYRRDVAAVAEMVDEIKSVLPYADFDATNTVKAYVDSGIAGIRDYFTGIIGDYFSNELTISQYANTVNTILDGFTPTLTVKSYVDDKTNGIYAEQCVDFYGADPTGVSDSSAAIEACINANKGKSIYFNAGTYLISRKIETPYPEGDRIAIYGNGAMIKPTAQMDCMLDLGSIDYGVVNPIGVGYKKFFVNDLTLWNEDGFATTGIHLVNNYRACVITRSNIIGFKRGIVAGDGSNPTDLQIDNCNLRYTEISDVDSIGIWLNGTDNKICNSYIIGFHTCVKSSGGLYAFNIHNLPKGFTQSDYLTKIADSLFFELSGDAVIDSCYCDTYENFIKIIANGDYKITNCNYFSYLNPMNMTFLNVATSNFFQGSISLIDCTFNCRPTPSGNPTNASVRFGDWSINRLLKALSIDNCYVIGTSPAELVSSLVPWDFFKHLNNYQLRYANDNNISANAWVPLVAFVLDKNSACGFEFDVTYFFGSPRKQSIVASIFGVGTFWQTENISDLSANFKYLESALAPLYEYGYTAVKGPNQTVIMCVYVRNTSGNVSTNMQVSLSNEFSVFHIDPWNVPRMAWRTYNLSSINSAVFDMQNVQTITFV